MKTKNINDRWNVLCECDNYRISADEEGVWLGFEDQNPKYTFWLNLSYDRWQELVTHFVYNREQIEAKKSLIKKSATKGRISL